MMMVGSCSGGSEFLTLEWHYGVRMTFRANNFYTTEIKLIIPSKFLDLSSFSSSTSENKSAPIVLLVI